MATSKHSAPARPTASPRKPTNPLGRPYWVLGLMADEAGVLPLSETANLPATCATLTKGVHAIAHLLCNSEAFRELQQACDETDPRQTPLSPSLTESLFAALYMLSEQAEQACMAMLDASLEASSG